ncbi:zinc finger protein 699-like [Anoplopoma fimbria]|uniref:zinc finger protein 699-like n=1 Tax=Anoplopoma fimbria TaxID=229290 RepID=UPI0023EE05F5|nr:zinc finger protein 699-like [Anoplopoma fimbria]
MRYNIFQSTMSSFENLREFVNERLSAAAEEIFGVFEKAIVEYEKEIDRQRRLLDVVWKPDIKLHRIEFPNQHVCKEEEVLSDQQLCIQERNSSLDQEDPEPPQVKEEQEELCISQEGEQLELKQETETFVLTPSYEESDHSEDQTMNSIPDYSRSAAEKESLVIIPVGSVVPEVNSDHQLLPHNSHEAESQVQKGGKHGDSETTRNTEQNPKSQHQQSRKHVNNVHNSTHCNTHMGKKTFQCDMCNKAFKFKSRLQRHLLVHIGERHHSYIKTLKCDTCGRAFIYRSSLLVHMRTHSGEKPYSCNICSKRFSQKYSLNSHIRIHSGEKPYSCKICGKTFGQTSALNTHITIHTGEKPFSCKLCGKDFRLNGDLTVHMRIHTGEKPFTCTLCGKSFRLSGDLAVHMRRPHNGLKR